MLDTSRRYYRVETILKIINTMRVAKLNKFHWHITDDDSVALQFESYPNLTDFTAFSKREIYTRKDAEMIEKYAAKRGIDVVPEVDSPAHSRAMGNDPEILPLLTCFQKDWPWEIQEGYVIKGGPPTGAFDPTLNESYDYLKKILGDTTNYFSSDVVHLGGDEVLLWCWKSKDSIKKYMDEHGIKDSEALMNFYLQRERQVLRDVAGKRYAAYWSNPDTFYMRYGEGDVVQYWGLQS